MATDVANETIAVATLPGANVTGSTGKGFETPFLVISPETLSTFQYVANVAMGTPMCVFGLIGNALGVACMQSVLKTQRLSLYIYLMALFGAHWLYLLLTLFVTLPELINTFNKEAAFYLAWKTKVAQVYLDGVINFESSVLLIVVSCERLVSLLKPLTCKSSSLATFPKTIIASSIVFSVIFHIPFLTGLTTVKYENASNVTSFYITKVPSNKNIFRVFFVAQTTLLYYVAPAVVTILNASLPLVYSRIRQRQKLQLRVAHYRNQFKITTVVAAIATLYLLLSVPNMFSQTLGFIDKEYSVDGKYRRAASFFLDLGNFLASLNAALAVVVFLLVSRKFRGHLGTMFARILGRNKAQRKSGASASTRASTNTVDRPSTRNASDYSFQG